MKKVSLFYNEKEKINVDEIKRKKFGLDKESIERNRASIKKVSFEKAEELGHSLSNHIWYGKQSYSHKKDIVEMKIKTGANLDLGSLHIAIKFNYFDIVLSLLKYGADVNKINKSGQSPLMTAVSCDSELVPLLLLMNPDIDFVNTKGESALSIAVEKNNLDMMKKLLENGANANTYFVNHNELERKEPLIMMAVRNRNVEIAGTLIKHGNLIPPEYRNNFSDTDNLFMLEVTDYVFNKQLQKESNDDAVSLLVKQAKSDLDKVMKK